MSQKKETPEERDKRKQDLDKKLDKELADTFPTSDPPSLSQPTKNELAGDPKVKP